MMCVIEVCLDGEAPGGALRANMATGRLGKLRATYGDDAPGVAQAKTGRQCAAGSRKGVIPF